MLCSWIDGYPADFEGLEPSLQEQLLGRLRWALGSGSEAEKSFLRARTPAMRGEPEEEDEDEEGAGVLDDRNPDPHYILGLQAEDVAAQLTLQDSVSLPGLSSWAPKRRRVCGDPPPLPGRD